jgi:hypothetical protein
VSAATIGKIFVVVGLPVAIILIAGFGYLIHRYRIAAAREMNRRLKSDSQLDPAGTGTGV